MMQIERDVNSPFNLEELLEIRDTVRQGNPPNYISHTYDYVPALAHRLPGLLDAWEEFIIAKRKLDHRIMADLNGDINEMQRKLFNVGKVIDANR